MNEQHKCSGKINKGWHSYSCSKNGKFECEGKFYCGMHHPPTVFAKNQARTAAWHKELDEKRAAEVAAAAAKAEVARRASLFPDLLTALEGLVSCINETRGPNAHAALESARAAIARALPQVGEKQ